MAEQLKIAVIGGYSASCESLAAASVPNKAAYASHHGYACHFDRIESGGWSKMAALLRYLPRYDVVLLIDLDTIIMNLSIGVESLAAADLTVSQDAHGLNMGVSVWRRSGWSIDFATKIFSRKGHWHSSVYEQDSVAYFLPLEPRERWQVLPQRSMNSYCYGFYQHFFPHGHPLGEYQPGDFLIHLPGMSNESRIDFINHNLHKVAAAKSSGIAIAPPENGTAIDLPHAALLAGIIASCKPDTVAEIGIGSGYCTRIILQCLGYNQKGALTCVDNFLDSSMGMCGSLSYEDACLLVGADRVVRSSDRQFVLSDQKFDIIVSDADHQHSHEWA